MIDNFEKIEKAKNVLQTIAKGVNPLTGEIIEEDSFLNDVRISRCFYFVAEIMDNVINGAYRTNGNKLSQFIITPEQKQKVEFPEGKIGVNEFSKCVNLQIDLNRSKKLSGVEINKRLKKMGILSEVATLDGKTRTTANQKSSEYGLETEKRTFNGVEYDMVVINDKGKKYLLDNIETILATE